MSHNLLVYGTTDRGKIRETNEDSFYIDDNLGFFAVADGMGGHNSGEVASKLAVEMTYKKYSEMVLKKVKPEVINKDYSLRTNILISSVDYANSVIYQKSKENESYKGMGTTLTVGVVEGDNISIVHIGDSRAYILRDNNLIQLTNDDSLVMEQYRKGFLTLEEAKKSSFRNVLTRALGIKQYNNYFTYEGKLKKGDFVILTTDGLTRMIEENEMIEIINKEKEIKKIVETLINLANEKGGEDNITVVVGRFVSDTFIDKLKSIFK